MAGEHENGRLRYEWLFEWVIVPSTGLLLAVYGSVSGKVNVAWIPGILFLIAFPFARTADRLLRRDK